MNGGAPFGWPLRVLHGFVHEFDREKWFVTLQDLLSRYNLSNGFSLTNLVTDSDVFTRQPFINLVRIRTGDPSKVERALHHLAIYAAILNQ